MFSAQHAAVDSLHNPNPSPMLTISALPDFAPRTRLPATTKQSFFLGFAIRYRGLRFIPQNACR
jgi:hypothetical protein